MAHHYNSSIYTKLVDRLNQFPQGAPPSESLYKILKILFSEKEAELVSQLPIRPFTVSVAAKIWKIREAEAQNILEQLASRALLLDMEQKGEQHYCLPPPMAGFFEFSLMRTRTDIDQAQLSELFYQYLNVEEDFIKALFVGSTTPLGRIFPHEQSLEPRLEVLDYERASQVIAEASHLGISMCYCRHKMQHLDKACSAPMDVCMTFNTSAYSLIKHGHARSVSREECLDVLQQVKEHHLVQFGENVREKVNFICNCCSCCCEALQAIKRFSIARTIHSNYLAQINDTCKNCFKCIKLCPVDAIIINSQQQAFIDSERCIGCGVCLSACKHGGISMEHRAGRAITPLNTSHRILITAAEKGLLKELIEDNNVLENHRLTAAVLGNIVKSPGRLRDFAVKQLKSRYIEKLLVNT